MRYNIHEITLDNGAKGILVNMPDATTVYSKIYFRAGYAQVSDRKSKEQTAHIMEHMSGLVMGYETKGSYDEDVTRNGAYRNASTSINYMNYLVRCPDYDCVRTLELQRLSICRPNFTENSLRAERGNVKSELSRYLSSPNRVVSQKNSSLLGNGILPLDETIRTIDNVTLDDVVAHHTLTHVTNNMRFIVAGNIGSYCDDIIKVLERYDELSKGKRIVINKSHAHDSHPYVITNDKSSSVVFQLSMQNDAPGDEDEYWSMQVLNYILTGNYHSAIFGQLRVKGLSYNTRLGYAYGTYGTSENLYGQMLPENVEKLSRIAYEAIAKLMDGNLSGDEISRAKHALIGQHYMGYNTDTVIADYIGAKFVNDGPVRNPADIPDIIRSVNREKISEVVRKNIADSHWVLGAYGPISQANVDVMSDIMSQLRR